MKDEFEENQILASNLILSTCVFTTPSNTFGRVVDTPIWSWVINSKHYTAELTLVL